ncbi:MAG: hypothetical protein FWG66_11365, partial [Spirochaetes bacterium]|nr:hypothetical protein [Spirochaetota bacterium]
MKTRSFASRASARRGSPAGLPCFQQKGKHTEAQRHGALLREPLSGEEALPGDPVSGRRGKHT